MPRCVPADEVDAAWQNIHSAEALASAGGFQDPESPEYLEQFLGSNHDTVLLSGEAGLNSSSSAPPLNRSSRAVFAVLLSSTIVRMAAGEAFESKRRSVTSPDIIGTFLNFSIYIRDQRSHIIQSALAPLWTNCTPRPQSVKTLDNR